MTQKPTRPEVVDETLDAADAPENAAPEQEQAEGETLEDLVNERDDLKDKLLRALAEMENLRRRTEREVADARAYGIAGFARDMLTVADNIQRALESLPAELRDNEAIKPFVEGVELTERDFLKTLERHGVRKLVPQGERFDPNLHQAMFEVPDTSVPNGTVVQVVQAGFVIGERVLRPALVGVSKGGPKPGSAESGPAAPADEPKPN
ncbi:nucleotide exchange factor GrpE [Chelatococcus composti]|jgi:molecular chaperone GrpE|uniref:Protein GrpE n=1 Tax=Chelatococcus composti TaxID=1743235 RepID=A0A841K4T3_9HYPH|nr:nucleotide exchange factor GrpE [Chelatococcus composti]MBB6167315.1 molecular chaperone GrpE [Chelatococcus composti]MBS7735522.1 nucleotide exchange factor GrpE [Chelatococcus composti]GGG30941.1 protein GrpE [Chelatococcus composti]